MKYSKTEEIELSETGGKRERKTGKGRFDLIPYEAIEAWSLWAELGAERYGDRNWEKGISIKQCMSSMIRHAIKAAAGWSDEDHLAAVMMNAGMIITLRKRGLPDDTKTES